jgi:hypothetical protein
MSKHRPAARAWRMMELEEDMIRDAQDALQKAEKERLNAERQQKLAEEQRQEERILEVKRQQQAIVDAYEEAQRAESAARTALVAAEDALLQAQVDVVERRAAWERSTGQAVLCMCCSSKWLYSGDERARNLQGLR